jgi:predicted ATPase
MGQSENYYETLEDFGTEYREWFLKALRDCAFDLSILESNKFESVLSGSLLRDIDMQRVKTRFHRLANGDAELTPYDFKYLLPADPLSPDPPPLLSFSVRPNSYPPTNIHVLIGRNGVGKTRCFDLLSRAFLGMAASDGGAPGSLTHEAGRSTSWRHEDRSFAGLVTVSFSPFDKYGPLVGEDPNLSVKYDYVGLIRETAIDAAPQPQDESGNPRANITIKSHVELTEDFIKSIEACRRGARHGRWTRALKVLEADPLFAEVNVSSVGDADEGVWRDTARQIFKRLSSGHSVVLLTVTRLVELVEERSLILIDEPESHLHPPLLSAFVRALSDLLTNRNGVALIATHSPVVLQEVPRNCAWILNRSGRACRADRPQDETFGENVGVLTREVFGLEVTQTGFHRMIEQAIVGRAYNEILALYDGQLGSEARALARALTLLKSGAPSDETEL